ncbi:kinase-like domain-containing protein [Mycena galericulata]|nr:kinase-like domain-containing protein [Mycena galericulata]
MLFTIRSYKKDIPTLPKEHAIAAMNLIHYILDGGLPENGAIQDYENFARQGHLVLNRLAQYVGILPEELTIQGVVLLSEAPVNGGGFSNIYQGVYTNSAGEQVEVALKVLRIFEDQPDERRQILHNKFSQEALVWHYLKHKNIVHFLGVDSTTFRSPVRAMVSPWMPLGSVLKYMVENPSSPSYALGVLSDVLDGLSYLHSANVIHGDLCGRNILMDENGRARLTDFGLASFIESDTSMKSTTRSGTTRWMAPELLRPAEGVHFRRTTASDVWAFGCVCCEIWSGGDVPFGHLGKEMEILFAVFAADAKGMPYPNRPIDKAGNPMPNQLWELAQACWSLEPSERPLVPVLVKMISEMKPLTQDEDATGSQSGDIALVGGSGNSTTSKSDERICKPVTRKGKGRAHVQEDATVRFGPVDIDGDPEELLESMMDGLLNFVDPELLTEPMAVEAYDSNHLGLRFRSPIEANNFAMTWMVYRFEPYAGVSAELLN